MWVPPAGYHSRPALHLSPQAPPKQAHVCCGLAVTPAVKWSRRVIMSTGGSFRGRGCSVPSAKAICNNVTRCEEGLQPRTCDLHTSETLYFVRSNVHLINTIIDKSYFTSFSHCCKLCNEAGIVCHTPILPTPIMSTYFTHPFKWCARSQEYFKTCFSVELNALVFGYPLRPPQCS